MRGPGSAEGLLLTFSRFTPTSAGIGSPARAVPLISPVHPRSCGDRIRRHAPTAVRAGSSPLVRGSVRIAVTLLGCFRFIPARAGIGRGSAITQPSFAVHPRSCGDRGSPLLSADCACGSSPLVRGSGVDEIKGEKLGRFIPARAGIGSRIVASIKFKTVHPRSCGDRCPC